MVDTVLTITPPTVPLSLTFDARLRALIEQSLADLGLTQVITKTVLDDAIAADNIRDDAEYLTSNITDLPPLP